MAIKRADNPHAGEIFDITGTQWIKVWVGNETAYAAVDPKDTNTLYCVYADE